MNAPAPTRAYWTDRRWWLAVGGVFLAQVLLVWMLAAQHAPQARPLPPDTACRMPAQPVNETDLGLQHLASDPTLFVLAHPRGFSGRGWLNHPTPTYNPTTLEESPRYHEPSPDQFIQTFREVTSRSERPQPKLSDEIRWPEAQPATVVPPPAAAAQLHLEGSLRLAQPAPPLPVQASTNDVLAASVVQVAVLPDGSVFSARLVGRSGSAQADQQALRLAQSLRFASFSAGGDPARLAWGRLTFPWQTRPSPVRKPASPASPP